MRKRATLFLAIAVLAVSFCAGPAVSAEDGGGLSFAQLRSIDNGVRSAFAIPSGYGMTPNIRGPLQAIYNRYEPILRQKLIAIQSVTDPDQKKMLVQEILQLRKHIRAQAIPIFQAEKQRILRQMEAARQKKLAEIRKRQQQQRKKGHHKKKKRR